MPVVLLSVALAAGCGAGESRVDAGQEGTGQAQTVILEMDEFTLQANSDGFVCQTYENPFGSDVRIIGWEFQSGSSSAHHLLVFPDTSGQAAPVSECQMSAQDQIVLGSQAPNDLVSYPTGVGTDVDSGTALRMRIHYDNRADSPEVVDGPRLKITYVQPEEAPRVTGLYSFTNTDIHVDPGAAGSTTHTVLAPEDMELVWMVSHYHDHGVNFTTTVRDEVVYTAGDVNNPPETRVFDPPLLVKKGEPITFQCDYQADADQGLVFGGSLRDDEMCNVKGGYLLPAGGVPAALMQTNGAGCFAPPAGAPPMTGLPSRTPSTDGTRPPCPPSPPATTG